MQILTESAIRTYCFAKNERDEKLKNASTKERTIMKLMAIFKNPIPIDTIVYCMKNWFDITSEYSWKGLKKILKQGAGLSKYIGEDEQNLKKLLTKWLKYTNEYNIKQTASKIKREYTKTINLHLMLISGALGAAALASERSTQQQEEAGAYLLVGAGFLYALENGIAQAIGGKIKSYYKSAKAKTKEALKGVAKGILTAGFASHSSQVRKELYQSAKEKAQAAKEKAKKYYESLKNRFWSSKKEPREPES